MSNPHKRTVAVDFDGCLAAYDKWQGALVLGDPLPGAKEFMEALIDEGYEVIVFTCRSSGEWEFPNWGHPGRGTGKHLATESITIKVLTEWFKRHRIPFSFIWNRSGKPHADAYVDDRAVSCAPMTFSTGKECRAYALAFADVMDLAGVEVKTEHPIVQQFLRSLQKESTSEQAQPTDPSSSDGDGEQSRSSSDASGSTLEPSSTSPQEQCSPPQDGEKYPM